MTLDIKSSSLALSCSSWMLCILSSLGRGPSSSVSRRWYLGYVRKTCLTYWSRIFSQNIRHSLGKALSFQRRRRLDIGSSELSFLWDVSVPSETIKLGSSTSEHISTATYFILGISHNIQSRFNHFLFSLWETGIDLRFLLYEFPKILAAWGFCLG